MLHTLHIRNLALIERAELRMADGLTVVSGETGGGKSLLITALIAALLVIGAAVLFTVQNLARVTDLSFSLGFWGLQLHEPLPVPYLLWIAFVIGLLVGGSWAIYERVAAGRKVRDVQRKLDRASLGG